MSREIKFRCWNPSAKRMERTFDIDSEGNVGRISMFETYESEPTWVLMQFTGLLDSSNKEIYEGDIVEVNYNYRVRLYLDKFTCKFSNGGFNFFYKGNERIVNVDTTVYTIIGNIHQNPELI